MVWTVLWEKYGTSVGESITTTAFPTVAVSNFTTVAAALSTASNHTRNKTVDSCFKLTPYWGNLVRPLDDPDYPWLGLWTSLFITSVWYFCTDQVKYLLEIKYMLFAGWEVRIVKNCERGLENAARGRRPRAAFSRPRSQFFAIRTDPKPVNNFFFFFAYKKLFQFL